jgi:DNA-directed RNA polymerase specialized sigma24 family protein
MRMQTLEHPDREATRLYRLAYLLTGDEGTSLDVALAVIEDGASPFFSQWMLAWSRRVVISKALVAIRGELAASATRTAVRRADKRLLPAPGWTLSLDTNTADLDRALLTIDLFPRCALLLSVFERVPLADAAILMDSTPALVENARNLGLRELTANLAPSRPRTSTATGLSVITGEMQHA